MPRCKNCVEGKPVSYYTGKENNPRGRGYCARHESEGKKMKGRDKKMYEVHGNRWVRVTSSSRKTSPRGWTWGGSAENRKRLLDEVHGSENKKQLIATLCDEIDGVKLAISEYMKYKTDENKEKAIQKYDDLTLVLNDMEKTYTSDFVKEVYGKCKNLDELTSLIEWIESK